MPPIDAFRVGKLHFVIDGHHRVSVARAHGDTHIDAYVREVQTKVAVSDDLILRDLLRTRHEREFDERVPLPPAARARIELAEAWRYEILAKHVESWSFRASQAEGTVLSRAEAAEAWFNEEYERQGAPSTSCASARMALYSVTPGHRRARRRRVAPAARAHVLAADPAMAVAAPPHRRQRRAPRGSAAPGDRRQRAGGAALLDRLKGQEAFRHMLVPPWSRGGPLNERPADAGLSVVHHAHWRRGTCQPDSWSAWSSASTRRASPSRSAARLSQ
jgi:hypothetical protein